MFGGMGFFQGTFEARYRAYPVAFLDKPTAEEGDKVMLPPSALDRLSQLHIEFPMLFKVENTQSGRLTHCGVLEFIAEEGRVYMPFWMMQNLCLQDGDVARFTNVSLPKGTYVKLQPVTSDFLDISNPRAVLERSLRSYTCLTTGILHPLKEQQLHSKFVAVGDNIALMYNNKKYEIEIRETKPGTAISVIETDCNVDFEAPKDSKPPAPKPEPVDDQMSIEDEPEEPEDDPNMFLAFSGGAARLDGRPINNQGDPVKVDLLKSSMRLPAPPEPEADPKATTSGRGKGQKAGKVVLGGGNRLLEKLNKDKAGSASASESKPAPSTKQKKDEDEDEEKKSGFAAFSGKGFSLK